MASSINPSIQGFASELSAGLGKVSARFVQDFVIGVHRCRSVNLTDVARSLDEDIELHATHKRLSRNLARSDLTSVISDRLLAMAATRVGPDTRLIIHTYELNKRYAQRMEYLHAHGNAGNSRDIGSIGTSESSGNGKESSEGNGPENELGDGYRVCEIVASDTGSASYVPLLSTLWSRHAPGYLGDSHEIRQAVRRVLRATDGRGILHFDQFLLPQKILREMVSDPEIRFVSEVSMDANQLVYRRQIRDIEDLVANCQTPYGKTMFKLYPGNDHNPAMERSLFVHFGSIPVLLPESQRPLSLMVIKISGWAGDHPGNPVVTTECGLRSREALTGLLAAYSSVYDVVQAHRQHTFGYNLADFRVLTYERLQLLMTLLHAVVYYDAEFVDSVDIKKGLASFEPHPGSHHRDFLPPRVLSMVASE